DGTPVSPYRSTFDVRRSAFVRGSGFDVQRSRFEVRGSTFWRHDERRTANDARRTTHREQRTNDERRTTNGERQPVVVKFGGELLEDREHLAGVVEAVRTIATATPLVIVHGGGKEI